MVAALDTRARTAVDDSAAVPLMSQGHRVETPGPNHRGWWFAAAAAAVVVAVAVPVGVVFAQSSPGHRVAGSGHPTPPASSAGSSTGAHGAAPVTPSGPPARTVRVTSDLNDGAVVGIGEPIVLNFDPAPTDSRAFTKAVTVTVNGRPADGAWYWEKPYADQPIQAHYREQKYWPAHAKIEVKLPIGGLSAGKGLAYGSKLTSVSFSTGAAHVSTVDAQREQMTVTSDGQPVRTIPVSLGKAATPTTNGVKIVMQKGEDVPSSNTLRPNGAVRMVGPGYDELVDWSVRMTADGEYVHAAPWNSHIGQVSTSNGCTNLSVADAKWFYDFSLLGDVVQYANTTGSAMNPLDGLGDWNINWTQWQQGGQLLNH